MPFDALPDELNPRINPNAWKGTDNDTWYARWTIPLVGFQAFGPRAKEWWACWKFPPKVLFKVGGKGPWRYEFVPDYLDDPLAQGWTVLSRCQYFKRWAAVLEWPLSFRFHIYWQAKDVPVEATIWKNDFSISQLLFFYGPIHWDTQLVYWILSCYFGGQWK